MDKPLSCKPYTATSSVLKLLVTLLFCLDLTESVPPETVYFKTEPKFKVDNQELIIPTSAYQQKSYTKTFTVNYGGGFNQANSRIVFGISSFDFKQSAASFSFLIKANFNGGGGGGGSSYDYRFKILNETVLYQMKVYSAIIQTGQIDQVLYEQSSLTCTIMNKGVGYRSENISFPTSDKSVFLTEVNQIQAVVFFHGFNLFNPNGSFFYLSWEFNYNLTEYTVLFKTMDQNIVSSIDFSVLIVDFNRAGYVNDFQRMFIVQTVGCSNTLTASCPGKTEWPNPNIPNSPADHNMSISYLFGLSSFQIAKQAQARWFFDQGNLLNLANGYYQSPSIIWANMSVFIVSKLDCDTNGRFFDPTTMKTCETACTGLIYKNQFNSPTKICRPCHYSCQPGFCSDETINKCNQCDITKARVNDSNPPDFKCICSSGYIDVGLQQCQPCSKYILGCIDCSATLPFQLPITCNLCDTTKGFDSTPTASNKCICNTTTKYISLDGYCRSTYGCVNYFNDPVKGWTCVACNLTLNLFVDNYTCSCITGYSMIINPDGTKFCQITPAVCGDGVRMASEPCDDKNLNNGDGCSATCTIQTDFLCFGDLMQTSFCLQSRTTLSYVGTMKNQGLASAQLYFSIKPYNQLLQNVTFLIPLLTTSLSQYTSVANLNYFTKANLYSDELRVRLYFDYTEAISPNINHTLEFRVFDNASEFRRTTAFNIKGNNLELLIEQGYHNLIPLNYIILALVILAFIALFISIFKENWIGIQLMHTFQFCFFYFILLEEIGQKQVKFLSYLELCNGYNSYQNHLSLDEYLDFNRKMYLMNFRKQILLNFNFTSFLFTIPFIMLIVKVLRPFFQKCMKKDDEQSVQDSRTVGRAKPLQTRLDYFLSSQFIIGKLFVTFCLVFMNQIFFCFFIEQTPYFQEEQVFNIVFEQIILFLLVTCCMVTIGLLILAALRPFKFNISEEEKQFEQIVEFIKFKRFNGMYPVIYSIFIATKIIFMALFFTNKSGVYIMWPLEIIYMIGYAIFRPYKKTREYEEKYCYLLHNLHNLWNSFGLSVLLGVLVMENLKVNPDTYIMDLSIRITILIIETVSLVLAYMRLFASKKLPQIKLFQKKYETEMIDGQKLQVDETERRMRRKTEFDHSDQKNSPEQMKAKKQPKVIRYR